MAKTREQLRGLYVASITPYDQNGQANSEALLHLAQRNLREGAAGFFVGGSSGECFLLTEQERIQTFEAMGTLHGQTNLIAHVGAVSTAEAVRYAKAAMAAGFDYTAATAPFYYGFTPREVCGYYRAIAEASGAPVLIYNFPGNTHREFDLHNPEYLSLLRSGAILGVKQTSYNLFQLERILNINPDLVAFDGYDETMVAGLSLGCIGNIGSTFNCMLPHYLEIYNLYNSGRTDEALALQHTANNCMEALCKHGLIASIKYVLGQQGYDVGDPRAPFLPLEAEHQTELDTALAANLWQP